MDRINPNHNRYYFSLQESLQNNYTHYTSNWKEIIFHATTMNEVVTQQETDEKEALTDERREGNQNYSGNDGITVGTTFNGSVESEVRVTDSDRMVGINRVRLFVGLFIYLFASVSVVTDLCLYLSLCLGYAPQKIQILTRILGERRLLICPGSRKTGRFVFVWGRARIYLYPRELIVLQPLTFLPRTLLRRRRLTLNLSIWETFREFRVRWNRNRRADLSESNVNLLL